VIIIPAIDLKDGRCVRLVQGRMDRETVYGEDPVRMAGHWESIGAERLHVVDLNGAVEGAPVHRSLIEEIAGSVGIPVEVGGGIRDLKTIEEYLSSGVRWVILGTTAFQSPSMIAEACRLFPGRIILGVDARRGKVAIRGWNEEVSREAAELVKEFDGSGLSAIVYTDIERDGMEKGSNLEMTKALARAISTPVIASGGVSGMEDIEGLKQIEPDGVIGAIVGKALYTGRLDLEEAIRVAKGA
jgi:phosphoribosylformimino-5-aminoimidazole carboxamide ribotide isomerase